MLFTIRCRRAYCGSRYQLDFGSSGLEDGARDVENQASAKGWVRTGDGWLCPADAPRPAAAPIVPHSQGTHCEGSGCLNLCRTDVHADLKANGWHRIGVGPWYCRACWNTIQPEPVPETEMSEDDLEREAAERRQEIRKVAKEVVEEAFQRLLAKTKKDEVPGISWFARLLETEANLPF